MLMQESVAQGLPEEGYALPAFTLEGAGGRSIRLWDYKQRRPVLLAFLHAGDCVCCRSWLHALAERQPLLDELRVVTLVVVPEPVERLDAAQTELGSSMLLLSDADGAVAARYVPDASAAAATEGRGRGPMALYAADRYLHCLGRWFASDGETLPELDEPLDEIAFAAQEGCGCSLPAWPPR